MPTVTVGSLFEIVAVGGTLVEQTSSETIGVKRELRRVALVNFCTVAEFLKMVQKIK